MTKVESGRVGAQTRFPWKSAFFPGNLSSVLGTWSSWRTWSVSDENVQNEQRLVSGVFRCAESESDVRFHEFCQFSKFFEILKKFWKLTFLRKTMVGFVFSTQNYPRVPNLNSQLGHELASVPTTAVYQCLFRCLPADLACSQPSPVEKCLFPREWQKWSLPECGLKHVPGEKACFAQELHWGCSALGRHDGLGRFPTKMSKMSGDWFLGFSNVLSPNLMSVFMNFADFQNFSKFWKNFENWHFCVKPWPDSCSAPKTTPDCQISFLNSDMNMHPSVLPPCTSARSVVYQRISHVAKRHPWKSAFFPGNDKSGVRPSRSSNTIPVKKCVFPGKLVECARQLVVMTDLVGFRWKHWKWAETGFWGFPVRWVWIWWPFTLFLPIFKIFRNFEKFLKIEFFLRNGCQIRVQHAKLP